MLKSTQETLVIKNSLPNHVEVKHLTR